MSRVNIVVKRRFFQMAGSICLETAPDASSFPRFSWVRGSTSRKCIAVVDYRTMEQRPPTWAVRPDAQPRVRQSARPIHNNTDSPQPAIHTVFLHIVISFQPSFQTGPGVSGPVLNFTNYSQPASPALHVASCLVIDKQLILTGGYFYENKTKHFPAT